MEASSCILTKLCRWCHMWALVGTLHAPQLLPCWYLRVVMLETQVKRFSWWKDNFKFSVALNACGLLGSSSTCCANEVQRFCLGQADPLLPPSGLNGACNATLVLSVWSLSRGPVEVAGRRWTCPEPGVEVASVAQADPDVSGGGAPRHFGHLPLNAFVANVDKVIVVLPAVKHRLDPRHVFLDQNQVSLRRTT